MTGLRSAAASIRPVAGERTDTARPSASSVEYRHVTKRYAGQSEPAIDDLSLKVPAGDICVLVGPSGCGKTTALRLANRMIELSEGDILIDDESTRARPAAELRRSIGYVIQQIGLFPHLTIGENIAVVPKLLGWDRKRISARVDELLDLTDLGSDMRDRYPAQLSGGQRQRVGVARALAADPPLMLMDEPFGAIDPINRERLQNQFLRLQSEIRKTILFVTHDIDEAIKMGDRVAVLRRGGVLAQYATPEELLMSPADGFVEDFVGADRALKRLSLLRVRDIDLWKAPLARAGEPTGTAREAIAGSRPALPARDRRRGPSAGMDVGAGPGARHGPAAARHVAPPGARPRGRPARRALGPAAIRHAVRARGGRAGARRGRPIRGDRVRVPDLAAGHDARDDMMDVAAVAPVLAQVEIRDRSEASCISQNKLCPGWIVDNFDRYTDPLAQHVYLVLASVAIGFVIAFVLALVARRRRWLVGPIVGLTGVLYTLPSLAVFFLLLPITGRGSTTAIIALTAYTLQIIFRNIILGLQNVPAEARDAGRGVGLTDRQLLWRVELPLAIPDIIAGLRIATTSTVGLATLAVFAGAGGLGEQIVTGSNITFKTGVVVAGGLAILLAFALDVILLLVQRALTPWRRVQPA